MWEWLPFHLPFQQPLVNHARQVHLVPPDVHGPLADQIHPIFPEAHTSDWITNTNANMNHRGETSQKSFAWLSSPVAPQHLLVLEVPFFLEIPEITKIWIENRLLCVLFREVLTLNQCCNDISVGPHNCEVLFEECVCIIKAISQTFMKVVLPTHRLSSLTRVTWKSFLPSRTLHTHTQVHTEEHTWTHARCKWL